MGIVRTTKEVKDLRKAVKDKDSEDVEIINEHFDKLQHNKIVVWAKERFFKAYNILLMKEDTKYESGDEIDRKKVIRAIEKLLEYYSVFDNLLDRDIKVSDLDDFDDNDLLSTLETLIDKLEKDLGKVRNDN